MIHQLIHLIGQEVGILIKDHGPVQGFLIGVGDELTLSLHDDTRLVIDLDEVLIVKGLDKVVI